MLVRSPVMQRTIRILALVGIAFFLAGYSAEAQGPADIPRLDGRIDRLNDRVSLSEAAIDDIREDLYGRDGVLVVLGRHESQIADLRDAATARNTVILASAASVGVNLALLWLQTFFRRKNGHGSH